MEYALEALYHRSMMSALAAFALTLGVVMLLSPLARKYGLVDRPGGRKTHAVATPLIGGIAMLLGAINHVMTLAQDGVAETAAA